LAYQFNPLKVLGKSEVITSIEEKNAKLCVEVR
jgi:hypothetical protein